MRRLYCCFAIATAAARKLQGHKRCVAAGKALAGLEKVL